MDKKNEIRKLGLTMAIVSVASWIILMLLPYGLLALLSAIVGFFSGLIAIAALFNVYIEPLLKGDSSVAEREK